MVECRIAWCNKTATRKMKIQGNECHYCTSHFLKEKFAGKIMPLIGLGGLIVGIISLIIFS